MATARCAVFHQSEVYAFLHQSPTGVIELEENGLKLTSRVVVIVQNYLVRDSLEFPSIKRSTSFLEIKGRSPGMLYFNRAVAVAHFSER